MAEDNQQELLFKLSMFEQQIRQLQEQINAVENGILELESLGFGLEELKNSEGKEIMAPVGRGIFLKSKILSKDLIVDIGQKNFVKKSVPETQKMIGEQVERLKNVRQELELGLEEMGREVQKMIGEKSYFFLTFLINS